MIDKRIGQRFKQCREKLGLTQEEFKEDGCDHQLYLYD